MKEIAVLLSSYNGQKYIKEQIDSILNQKDVKINLLVRDDGSTDNTINILEEYKAKGLLQFYKGKNLGPAKSFLDLLRRTPEADFYAFSDQDDYWNSDKLICAIDNINFYEKASLYYSQTQLADKNLNPLHNVIINPKGTFGEALIYQFIGGCTMVMNKQLRKIINAYEPRYLPMHDVWIYDVAKAIDANVIFDPTPHMLYRQHGDNAIGQGYSNFEEWKRRFSRIFIKNEHLRYRLALELKNGYYNYMNEYNRKILDTFINYRKSIHAKLELMTSCDFKCAEPSTYHKFQLAVLFNKI